jgi:hypothetical protein
MEFCWNCTFANTIGTYPNVHTHCDILSQEVGRWDPPCKDYIKARDVQEYIDYAMEKLNKKEKWCPFQNETECLDTCMAYRKPGHPDFERYDCNCIILAAMKGFANLSWFTINTDDIADKIEQISCSL